MKEQTFELKSGKEYIQLNNLLQYLSLAQTGGHAKILIQNQEVLLNETIETRIRKKVFTGDVVQLNDILIHIK